MREVAELLRGIRIDRVYTSNLQRTRRSAEIVLATLDLQPLPPIVASADLRERFYGELEGQNRTTAATRYGAEQVQLWRRSYDVAPPGGESLCDAAARILPFTIQEILPHVQAGENVLLCAHGNTLRVVRMHLEGLTPETLMKLEVATGELKEYKVG